MIYVIGSIGSGKTSLTKALSDDMGTNPYYEDVNNGLIKGMLQEFYSAGKESRKRISAMLQVAFLTVRFQQLRKALVERNSILDSNLLSDYIMATNLFKRSEMDEASYNVYLTLNQEMQEEVDGHPFASKPDLVVYLSIDPEHEIEEIQKRGRGMEDIRKDPKLVDYYHSVNQAFHNWYNGYYQSRVVKIDRDHLDFVNDPNDRNNVLDMIEKELISLGQLTEEEYQGIVNRRKNA